MINAAIVGLGWWGQQHVLSAIGSSGLRYVSAVSKEPDQVSGFASKHHLHLVTDYDDVLIDPAIEAVVLCTPHLFHPEQIVAAARAGKHVYCEKPLSLSRAGAVTAVAACEASGVVLAVGHDKRCAPAYEEFKAAIRSGSIGGLLSVETNANLDTIDVSPTSWKTAGENAASLGLINYGVHRIDALIDIFGKIRRVFARRSNGSDRSVLGVDSTMIVFEFESGLLGYLGTLSYSISFSRLQVFGPEGSITMRGWNEVLQSLRGRDLQERKFEALDTVRANVESFAKSIRTKRPFHISHAEIIHTASVMEACLSSIRSGQFVDVDV